MLSKIIAVGIVLVAISNIPNFNSYQQKAVQVDFCDLPESQAVVVRGEIITLNQGIRNTDFTIKNEKGCTLAIQIRSDKVQAYLEEANTYEIKGKATQGIITNVTSIQNYNQADTSKYKSIKTKAFTLSKFREVNANKYTTELNNSTKRIILSVTRSQMYALLKEADHKLTVVPNGNEFTLIAIKQF